MRVLVDATALPADRRGVGRYLDNLLPALCRLGIEVHVASQPRDASIYEQVADVHAVVASSLTARRPGRLVWEQFSLPALARRVRPDVLHSPHYTHPVMARGAQVVTLHDATFFTDPKVHTGVKGPFFRAATRLALRRVGCCVVPSQSTADALHREVGADPSRLQVAHLGVDHSVFHPPSAADIRAVRSRLQLASQQPYLAFLGTLEPRKNVAALIRGWISAVAGRPDPPALVVAGGSGWNTDLDAVAVPAGLRLVRPGYFPLDLLPGFLGGAELVVYPSLGEGFGLPVLEAMSCGAAVLTSARMAIPEVGGDAVAYCDTDSASIGRGISELLDDPARRTDLGSAAEERAASFTWDACAQAHVMAYERAIEAGH
ncbi:MAG: glycosyltransferase family 1 protein [bacterium]